MVSPDVMSLTPHHAKYYAYDLTRRAASGMDRLSMALFEEKRDQLIDQLEQRLAQRTQAETLFTIRWAVV